jgi:putative Ca2+/H+ antiporter (TMEM165/GDT1 family)
VPVLELDPLTAAEVSADSQTFPADPLRSSKPKAGILREFLTAFITIFLAEIGDKTQLATLLMAAESQSPWIVFAGAAAALLCTSLLGVWVGRWLARQLSEDTLQTATGIGMLLISVLLLWDVVHLN